MDDDDQCNLLQLMLDSTSITSKTIGRVWYNISFNDSFLMKELILHSVSGRNPVTIDLAFAAKKKVKIVALTNVNYSKQITSRHSFQETII